MCRIGILLILLLVVCAGAGLSASAQDDTGACPALVSAALQAASESCSALGRNEACYGHNLVTATAWEAAELDDFAAPGDLADVTRLAALATFPLSVGDETWGVALLSLQADLPETLPGQNVTFVVYGEAELRSDVSPEVLAAPTPTPLPTCTGRTSGGTNLRTGPSTAHAVAGSVGAGQAFTVSGRDASGEWLRVTYRAQDAWVYAPLLALDCDAAALPEVDTGTASRTVYTTPMQAFYLTTGLDEPACAEAPRDGLLIQAPQGTTVHFMINGIEVAVGSTALLQVQGSSALGVNTFAGAVAVTSAGSTQTAAPGQRVDAAAGAAPAPPVPYDPADVANAPVELLPEPVVIPPPQAAEAAVNAVTQPTTAGRCGGDHMNEYWAPCAFNIEACDGGVQRLNAGFSYQLRQVLWLPAEVDANAWVSQITGSATIDGAQMPLLRGPVAEINPDKNVWEVNIYYDTGMLASGTYIIQSVGNMPDGIVHVRTCTIEAQ